MVRATLTAAVLAAMLASAGTAAAKPSANARTCTNSQTMKIPLKDLNKCALGGGVMKCTSGGYECCYDGGSFCEWTAYPTGRPTAGIDLTPPPGGYVQPPRPTGPDLRPPVGPKAPPMTPVPPRPRFDAGSGPATVALPPRTGPRVK